MTQRRRPTRGPDRTPLEVHLAGPWDRIDLLAHLIGNHSKRELPQHPNELVAYPMASLEWWHVRAHELRGPEPEFTQGAMFDS